MGKRSSEQPAGAAGRFRAPRPKRRPREGLDAVGGPGGTGLAQTGRAEAEPQGQGAAGSTEAEGSGRGSSGAEVAPEQDASPLAQEGRDSSAVPAVPQLGAPQWAPLVAGEEQSVVQQPGGAAGELETETSAPQGMGEVGDAPQQGSAGTELPFPMDAPGQSPGSCLLAEEPEPPCEEGNNLCGHRGDASQGQEPQPEGNAKGKESGARSKVAAGEEQQEKESGEQPEAACASLEHQTQPCCSPAGASLEHQTQPCCSPAGASLEHQTQPCCSPAGARLEHDTKPCCSPAGASLEHQTKPCCSPAGASLEHDTKPCCSPAGASLEDQTRPCCSPAGASLEHQTQPCCSPAGASCSVELLGVCAPAAALMAEGGSASLEGTCAAYPSNPLSCSQCQEDSPQESPGGGQEEARGGEAFPGAPSTVPAAGVPAGSDPWGQGRGEGVAEEGHRQHLVKPGLQCPEEAATTRAMPSATVMPVPAGTTQPPALGTAEPQAGRGSAREQQAVPQQPPAGDAGELPVPTRGPGTASPQPSAAGRAEEPAVPGSEDATDAICGLIQELSYLNRLAMSMHRGLEALRRSKPWRSRRGGPGPVSAYSGRRRKEP